MSKNERFLSILKGYASIIFTKFATNMTKLARNLSNYHQFQGFWAPNHGFSAYFSQIKAMHRGKIFYIFTRNPAIYHNFCCIIGRNSLFSPIFIRIS